ncbi:MAG TPA: cytochrome c biogenesis protein DipZ [Solirubrobacteraceae bacterium]|nr:cytochrome c biogenesis protein DipZ [Solirubrobacteraceae bacterium]
MTLLVLFAFVAGAGTAISPCVLPVLPALLSAGATGGRRRPLAIVLGLATTFAITVAGFAEVVDGVGLGDGALRSIAVVVLVGFGLTLLAPRLTDRLEAPLSRLARFGPRSTGDGFWSGLGVGAALGFVYAPCAGPILAAVISVSAASGTTVAIAIAYSLGSAVVLLALCLGGRRLLDRVRAAGRGPVLQRALGVVMLATALAVATDADVRFQTALADHFPSVLVNPTGSLERSDVVEKRLAELRGGARFAPSAEAASKSGKLPDLGRAPDFTGNQRWFNTSDDEPLTLAGLRGRVVLVDFWTYTCINCLRTFPYLRAWDAAYRPRGLTIVGVHTPEFRFERDAGNVRDAIAQNRLRYPVAQDNEYATWNAWGNQYWPAKYLIDAKGQVRYVHFGEGDDDATEAAIRSLLAEAGAERLGADARVGAVEKAGQEATPETYLGSARADGWVPGKPENGTHTYRPPRRLAESRFALGGRWRVDDESAEAVSGATLDANVVGKDVYLVLSSRGGTPRQISVELDGRPIRAADAGADVHGGRVTVSRQRLYRLVAVGKTGRHRLRLRFAPGVAGYAFTFG